MDATDKFGRTAIEDALLNQHNEVIEFLKKSGAKVDLEKFWELWMNAASDEDLDLMKSLMILGVNVNTCDYDKRTALHIAVSKHLTEVINFLLINKADPKFKDRWGKAPIDYAQDDNLEEVVKNMEMDNFLFR